MKGIQTKEGIWRNTMNTGWRQHKRPTDAKHANFHQVTCMPICSPHLWPAEESEPHCPIHPLSKLHPALDVQEMQKTENWVEGKDLPPHPTPGSAPLNAAQDAQRPNNTLLAHGQVDGHQDPPHLFLQSSKNQLPADWPLRGTGLFLLGCRSLCFSL